MAVAASCRTVPGPRLGDAGNPPQASVEGTGGGAPLPVEAYVPAPIVRVGIVVDGSKSVVSAPAGVIV